MTLAILLTAALLVPAEVEADRAPAYREFLLARLAGATGDLGAAASHLDEALTLDPGAAEIQATRAMLSLRVGRVQEAIDRARAATEADPDNALSWEVLSRAWAQNQRVRGEGMATSVAAQREVVRLLPDDPEPKLVLAQRLLALGDLDGAAETLDAAWAQGGRPRVLEMQLLEAYLRADRPDAGLERLSRVVDTVATAPASALALYRSLLDRGYAEHAGAVLDALASGQPDDPGLQIEVIRALLGAGRVDDAARLALEAEDSWPYPGMALLAGTALASAGELGPAERAFRQATEAAPEEPLSWRERGRLAERRGDPQGAAALYLRGADTVEASAPRAALALRVRGAELLIEAGKHAEALGLLEDLPALGGVVYPLEKARAVALASTRGLEAAEPPLERLRGLGDLPPGHLLEAEAETRAAALGEPATERWLRERVTAEDTPAVAVAAARFWIGRNRLDRALDLLREARERHGDSVELLVELGGVLDQSDHDDEAVSVLREALRLAPDDARALNNLAYLLALGEGSPSEAVELARRAVDANPESAAFLDTLGWALHRSGHTAEARDLLMRAAGAGGGDDPVIREHLGDVQRALGEARAAAENYRRALGLGPEDPDRIRAKLDAVTTASDGGS